MQEEMNTNTEKNIQFVRDLINTKKCEFNEESIDYVLNSLNKSFEETSEYSDENLKIILMCGLPDRNRKSALEFMRECRVNGISYRELHLILVNILREEHFFMDTAGRTFYLTLMKSMMQ